jgi:hypothetical protein
MWEPFPGDDPIPNFMDYTARRDQYPPVAAGLPIVAPPLPAPGSPGFDV